MAKQSAEKQMTFRLEEPTQRSTLQLTALVELLEERGILGRKDVLERKRMIKRKRIPS